LGLSNRQKPFVVPIYKQRMTKWWPINGRNTIHI
jgi:hypothetical protein